jgi:hypothetical protein
MIVAVGLPPDAVTVARTSPMWPAQRAIAHAICYDTRVMGDTRQGKREALHPFASVTVRTPTLTGGSGPTHQRNAVTALCAVSPNARMRTVAGRGHQFDPVAVPEFLDDQSRANNRMQSDG